MLQAAEKVTAVPETDGKGSCLLNKDEVYDERPPVCQEKSKKDTRQKKSGKAKSQENLTERENAKNHEKILANDFEHETHEPAGNRADEKAAPVKHGSVIGNHVDKRKKNKEKKMSGNKLGDNVQERQVIVNGSAQESGTHVEDTRGVRLPAREEAEPKHCGNEAPAQESQTENQGKKTKSRKKKKAQFLGKITNSGGKLSLIVNSINQLIRWLIKICKPIICV